MLECLNVGRSRVDVGYMIGTACWQWGIEEDIEGEMARRRRRRIRNRRPVKVKSSLAHPSIHVHVHASRLPKFPHFASKRNKYERQKDTDVPDFIHLLTRIHRITSRIDTDAVLIRLYPKRALNLDKVR